MILPSSSTEISIKSCFVCWMLQLYSIWHKANQPVKCGLPLTAPSPRHLLIGRSVAFFGACKITRMWQVQPKKTAVTTSCSCSSLFLFHLSSVLFVVLLGLRYECALRIQDGTHFLLLASSLKQSSHWQSCCCLLPSSSSEGSFPFLSLYGFLVNMSCCNRTSQ